MEFEKLRDMLPNVTLDTTAAREHVREIERKIRVIKERGRGMINTLPLWNNAKANGNWADALLCDVDELISSEVQSIQKMEPKRASFKAQAGCETVFPRLLLDLIVRYMLTQIPHTLWSKESSGLFA